MNCIKINPLFTWIWLLIWFIDGRSVASLFLLIFFVILNRKLWKWPLQAYTVVLWMLMSLLCFQTPSKPSLIHTNNFVLLVGDISYFELLRCFNFSKKKMQMTSHLLGIPSGFHLGMNFLSFLGDIFTWLLPELSKRVQTWQTSSGVLL